MAFLGDFGEGYNSFFEGVGGSLGLSKNESRNLGISLPGAGVLANYFTGADAKNAAKDAQKEADKTRKRAVVRQMGAREQADSIAMAGLRNSGMGSGQGSFLSNAVQQGSGSGISGTF